MNTNSKVQITTRESSRPACAEQRVNEPGVNLQLQPPPESFGATVAPEAIFEAS
jgi:hypothetical protein